MDFQTTDLCDANEGETVRACRPHVVPQLRRQGQRFSGPIRTSEGFEDNAWCAASSRAGRRQVLVVDGGGSMRCAMVGDQLGAAGRQNGWAGIVVYGCIRDSARSGAWTSASSPSAPIP